MNIVRRNEAPLSVYRPNPIEDQFGRMVETMLENFFAPLARYSMPPDQDGGIATSPRLNVSETDQGFEVEAELPGLKKEDVKVAIDQRRVTIEGESKQEATQGEGGNVVYSERSYRKYARSFVLPSDVDDNAAQARFEDGVLKLTLPKAESARAKQLTIQ